MTCVKFNYKMELLGYYGLLTVYTSNGTNELEVKRPLLSETWAESSFEVIPDGTNFTVTNMNISILKT